MLTPYTYMIKIMSNLLRTFSDYFCRTVTGTA